MQIIEHTDFDEYVEYFCLRKRNFSVETKRTTRSMYVNNEVALMSKGKKKTNAHKDNRKSVINLFSQVQKNVNKYIVKSQFTVEKVKEKSRSTVTDARKWNSLNNGDIFYYVDINHCYWRIAFLNGYITQKLYESTLLKPELKVERNMSLAMILAPKKRKYYKKGKLILEVEEEKSIYRTIYDNIRFTAYNLMGDCKKLAGSSFIGYRTDGIMLTEEAVNDIGEFISDKDFDYSIKECKKIDSGSYMNDKGKTVNF